MWLEQSGLGRVHNASPDVEDKAEEDSLPPYVPKQFKGALDNALDHNRRHLPEDAKEGLATHSMYRTERAQLTLAPEVIIIVFLQFHFHNISLEETNNCDVGNIRSHHRLIESTR
jgi:hypothetical protein